MNRNVSRLPVVALAWAAIGLSLAYVALVYSAYFDYGTNTGLLLLIPLCLGGQLQVVVIGRSLRGIKTNI